MDKWELQTRTKQFALRTLKLVAALPVSTECRTIGVQLSRSGTSVGANYRAACRARSKREFVAKLGTVEEEADESSYWMELIVEGGYMRPSRVKALLAESNEITRMIAASRQTAARTLARKPNRQSAIGNRQ